MREIKFRAWTTHRKRMYFSKMYSFGNLEWGRDFCSLPTGTSYEIMQYTGLKDKNGVEIYEGDIVKHIPSSFDAQECVGEIFWFAGHFRFSLRNTNHYLDSLNVYEVIGNIHTKEEKGGN